MTSVVLASSNQGKLQELAELLKPSGLTLRLQAEFSVEDAEESGLSFVENAILKARHAAKHTGHPSLADDSGLEVDALDGAPGIYSARFASLHNSGTGDHDNNQLLLEKLKGVPTELRTARFRCVLAYMRHELDPSPLIAEGSWEGRILQAPIGQNGFGYDPLFHATDTGKSAAQLQKAEKAHIGHRGEALRRLMALMQTARV